MCACALAQEEGQRIARPKLRLWWKHWKRETAIADADDLLIAAGGTGKPVDHSADLAAQHAQERCPRQMGEEVRLRVLSLVEIDVRGVAKIDGEAKALICGRVNHELPDHAPGNETAPRVVGGLQRFGKP